jgi:major type 1 subunit fimbrin (pilin)
MRFNFLIDVRLVIFSRHTLCAAYYFYFVELHMKIEKKALALAIFICASGVQYASAQDGRINFTGTLLDQTCTVTVNNQARLATVALPNISAASLGEAGKVAGDTFFQIELSSCAGAATKANAYFTANSGVDPVTGNLVNRGTATNVQLELSDKSGEIRVGWPRQSTRGQKFDIANGGVIMPYVVKYVATGAVSPGTVSSFATFDISYQ